MRKVLVVLAVSTVLAGCSTTERDVGVGTAAGALVGGVAGGTKGALIGAGAGAVGGLLVRNLRNGFCEYRDRNGQLYTARC